jgi:hypothetical protein
MPATAWHWVAVALDDPRRPSSPWAFPSQLGRPIDRSGSAGNLRRYIRGSIGRAQPNDEPRVPWQSAWQQDVAALAAAAIAERPTAECRIRDLAPLPFPYRCPVARMRRERGDVRPRVPGVLGARLGDRGTSTAIERNRAKAAATLAAQQLDATLRQQQQAPDAAGDAPQ